MIETENRRVSSSTRENRDEWLADLAGMASNRDVYAERREISAYGAPSALRSREANMTDRYDRDGHEFRNDRYETSPKHAPASYEDDYYDDNNDTTATKQATYAYVDEQDEQGPEWTYDEKRDMWVDRDGNPYVEAYAEGEEDRYAPAEDEYLAPRTEPRLTQPRKSRGSAVSLAALVLVASIGGGLAYAWKQGGFIGSDLPGIGSAPPVIKANTDPVKIKPAGTVAANDQATHEIFDRSNQTASPSTERLVRHEEQPVAVVPVRPEGGGATNVAVAPTTAPDATRPVTTSNITLPSTDNTPAADQTAAAGTVADVSAGDPPDGPRRVRTIKIMPDNSVVTGDAPITAVDPVPATRSVDVAAIAPASPQPGDAPASVPPAAESSPAVTDPAASDATPAPTIAPVTTAPVTTVPATPVISAPAAPPTSTTVDDSANATTVVEPAPPAEAAPPAVPPVRPRNIPVAAPRTVPATTPRAVPATTQVASAEPAAPASNGSYVVQVSSQKTPADAQAAFQSLQRKYASVIGGMKPSIRKVDLPERGTYYRVRVGSWASSTEAAAFCAKLKAAGGDCVIARN
jgi:hypothetical protein